MTSDPWQLNPESSPWSSPESRVQVLYCLLLISPKTSLCHLSCKVEISAWFHIMLFYMHPLKPE